jgi:hypothetical protein
MPLRPEPESCQYASAWERASASGTGRPFVFGVVLLIRDRSACPVRSGFDPCRGAVGAPGGLSGAIRGSGAGRQRPGAARPGAPGPSLHASEPTCPQTEDFLRSQGAAARRAHKDSTEERSNAPGVRRPFRAFDLVLPIPTKGRTRPGSGQDWPFCLTFCRLCKRRVERSETSRLSAAGAAPGAPPNHPPHPAPGAARARTATRQPPGRGHLRPAALSRSTRDPRPREVAPSGCEADGPTPRVRPRCRSRPAGVGSAATASDTPAASPDSTTASSSVASATAHTPIIANASPRPAGNHAVPARWETVSVIFGRLARWTARKLSRLCPARNRARRSIRPGRFPPVRWREPT